MKKRLLFCTALFFLSLSISGFTQVRNSSFAGLGAASPYFTQETIDNYRKAGWKCPDISAWPNSWGLYGNNGTVEFPRTGGVLSDGYAKLSGEGVYLTGYHGIELEDRNYVYTIWARGKGKLLFHLISYGKNEKGNAVQLVKPGEAAAGMSVEVNSEKWVRYRHLLVKTVPLWNVHPWVGVEKGALDIDEVDIQPSTPALDMIIKAESALYGSGALIEDRDSVNADAAFAGQQKSYREALEVFEKSKETLDDELVASMDAEIKALAPYVLADGLSAVQSPNYNEMIALTQVLNILSGKNAGTSVALKVEEAVKKIEYVPGSRKMKKNAVMITAIEPNKILYEEGEKATVKVTLKNTKAAEQKVTLIALQHVDLDSVSEVGRGSISIPAGKERAGESIWTVSYNVGPETFGRAIEVRVLDESGKEIDRWKEYYQVAKEWLRVQMHTGGRYNNMGHYFACEPTDWCVQPTDAEVWISGQAGYHVGAIGRQNEMKPQQQRGKKFTFYQNQGFCGIMGYEQMRQHPEYVLYDPNGQFAVDPVYGGYPSPMELASPIEAGPRRQAKKPYLNRQYTPWQHTPSNLAMEGMIEYAANCIKEYARRYGFDGVFIDGTIFINKGYGYDGKINLPNDKAKVARMNAAVQNTYCSILKKENPYFGTWYNYSIFAAEWYRTMDAYMALGAGVEKGESDEWIRAMHKWKNVSTLEENTGQFREEGDSIWNYTRRQIETLCKNRDYIVQKYGGNAIIGYIGLPISLDLDKPGYSKWGWPTLNYFMAQIISSQYHIVTFALPCGLPSLEPSFQFQTRYSRFLWAPDVKLVKDPEKTAAVKSKEEIWWKNLVYRRNTKSGYDLIIHLVRIPPTEKWDINWIDEPVSLSGVQVTADIGKGKVQQVYALRPYHFEEEQQTVEQKLNPAVSSGKVTVEIPPFRYYTMVVVRVKK